MNKPIYITIAVDIQAALATRKLHGSIYLIDSNKSNGSLHEGTEMLETSVQTGDVLVWFVSGLEVETKVRFIDISFPSGSVVNFTNPTGDSWSGTVNPGFSGIHQYNVNLMVEGRLMSMTTPLPSIKVN